MSALPALGPLAALTTAAAAALAVRLVLPTEPRLDAIIRREPETEDESAHGLRPVVRLSLRLLPQIPDEQLLLRLRQAGLARGLPPSRAAAEHLASVMSAGAVGGAAGGLAAGAAGLSPAGIVIAAALGALGGAARRHGAVERLVEERRRRLRVELYTLNQLLALDLRTGAGVAQSLTRLAQRSNGVAAEELRDVLTAVHGGVPLDEALEEAARLTPEPSAARTYRLLAKGARYGADLAGGLRALSDDLRRERVEALEREATRRRAAMLVPIIALLAPVMLLFVAAPLPSIVFGAR